MKFKLRSQTCVYCGVELHYVKDLKKNKKYLVESATGKNHNPSHLHKHSKERFSKLFNAAVKEFNKILDMSNEAFYNQLTFFQQEQH